MAEPQKKAFSWDDFDKSQAAPAAGGAKKPFLWDSGGNGQGPDPATMEASRERSAQPTQFELDRQSNAPNRGVISHAISSGKGLIGSLLNGGITSPTEAAGSGVAQAGQMAADDLDRQQAGRSTAYRIGAPLAQTIVPGLNPHAMERAADVGDAGGIVGEGLTPALATGAHLGGQLAAKGAGAGLKEVARLGLDESGQPKPLTKLVLGGERSRALTDLTAPRDENGMPYETKAQNLMRRGREQDALDRQAARQAKNAPQPSPFGNAVSSAAPVGNAEVPPVGSAQLPKIAAPTPPPEVGSPENPGFHSKIPTRMPRIATPEPELGSSENPGFHAKLPTRMPKISAPISEAQSQIPGVVAAPEQDVIRVPEPRRLMPNENVGYNASTPRKLLLDNALQGRPGAAEMLRNAGKTPLFVTEGGYAPPRERITFGEPKVSSPSDFTANRNITLNPIGGGGARPIVSPAHQFESSFGPEHQEVGDLAEWETGSREGVRPKKILVP